MTDETTATRRRASRPAGPAGGAAADSATATTSMPATTAGTTARVSTAKAARPVGVPARRPAHGRLVAVIGLVAGLVTVAVLGGLVALMVHQDSQARAIADRDQRFVATASQTVVNMFSYTQDNIDQSVERFVNGTSGPLHDMMSQPGNVENLKALFRETNASSETVINGSALEGVDEVAQNGSVLVSARVTVTDVDGVNMPSQPYRLRVIVHQDDNGHMTAYDLKYPNGGN